MRQKYPVYKDSGIEWLGEVPEHWDIYRLKNLSTLNDENLSENFNSDSEILYVDISSVDRYEGIQSKQLLKFSDAPSRARRIVRNGDVIISTVRTYLRAITPIINPESNLIVSTGFAVIRPNNKLNCLFASYLLRAPYFVESVVANSVGVNYPAINASDLISIKVAIPPINEQKHIVSFLDQKLRNIDSVINKKNHQIELLQKKREVLIINTVAKGLDINAKLIDSDFEWLGKNPDHWELRRLKYAVKLANEIVKENENGSPYVGLEHIESWTGKLLPNVEVLSSKGQLKKFKAGDVLFGKLRPYLAKVFRTYEEGLCTGEFLVIRPEKAIQDYLFYYLISRNFIGVVDSSTFGAKMPRANWDFIGNLPIPIPPLTEQEIIVNYLNQEIRGINLLIKKIKKSLGRLLEYRTALISATVTGKIDVQKEAA